jgi:hypothetical protein
MTLTHDGAIRENHVVEFEEGRRIAWRPAEWGRRPPGHLWRWELEPASASRTRVTCTYDWTQLTDQKRFRRARATTADKLRASLDRLAASPKHPDRPPPRGRPRQASVPVLSHLNRAGGGSREGSRVRSILLARPRHSATRPNRPQSDAPIFVKPSSIGIANLRRLADDRVDASRAWLGGRTESWTVRSAHHDVERRPRWT